MSCVPSDGGQYCFQMANVETCGDIMMREDVVTLLDLALALAM